MPKPPTTKTSTSTEKEDSKNGGGRHFAIYDVKTARPQIRSIFDAAERGDNKAIMAYSKAIDFDIDAKDRFGRTALIWAADCGHHHVCESLIRLNANINTTDSNTGRSAIHWAARTGSLSIVKLLIQYGANITKEDKFGLTPLYLAKSKGPEGDEVFQYLLQEGAPYNEMKPIRNIAEIEEKIRAEMAALNNEASTKE